MAIIKKAIVETRRFNISPELYKGLVSKDNSYEFGNENEMKEFFLV